MPQDHREAHVEAVLAAHLVRQAAAAGRDGKLELDHVPGRQHDAVVIVAIGRLHAQVLTPVLDAQRLLPDRRQPQHRARARARARACARRVACVWLSAGTQVCH